MSIPPTHHNTNTCFPYDHNCSKSGFHTQMSETKCAAQFIFYSRPLLYRSPHVKMFQESAIDCDQSNTSTVTPRRPVFHVHDLYLFKLLLYPEPYPFHWSTEQCLSTNMTADRFPRPCVKFQFLVKESY